MTLGVQTYGVLKGMLDGKNEQGQAVYLLFCALVGSKDVLFLETTGSVEPLDPALPWKRFLDVLRDRREGDVPSFFSFAASQMETFLLDQNLLPQTQKHGNVKTLEHALTRFLGERLALKAVGMVKAEDPSPEDVQAVLEEKKAREEAQFRQEEQGEEGEAPALAAPAAPHLVVLRCQPLMDPVRGVPLHDLKVGDEVLAALPEDSFFFGLFRNQNPTFDGVVAAKVTGIKTSETGSAQVDLYLSEGILGALCLSGNVRVRVPQKESLPEEGGSPRGLPPLFLGLVGLGVALLAAVLFLLFR
ncbi:hypothetical protein [Aminomonas paucivorans]|uniref:hypothetical protein n=1 Tax=Aminomonas paucivorans TaxID=81412 RepID=UPI003324E93C